MKAQLLGSLGQIPLVPIEHDVHEPRLELKAGVLEEDSPFHHLLDERLKTVAQ